MTTVGRPGSLDDSLTIEEYKRLKYEEYMSDQEIIEIYSTSMSSLSRWKKKNNVRYKPRHSPQEYKRLRRLEFTDRQIALIFDLTQTGLYYFKKRNGLIEEEKIDETIS